MIFSLSLIFDDSSFFEFAFVLISKAAIAARNASGVFVVPALVLGATMFTATTFLAFVACAIQAHVVITLVLKRKLIRLDHRCSNLDLIRGMRFVSATSFEFLPISSPKIQADTD